MIRIKNWLTQTSFLSARPLLKMHVFLGALVAISYIKFLWRGTLNLHQLPIHWNAEIVTRGFEFIFLGGFCLVYLSLFLKKKNNFTFFKLYITALTLNCLAGFSLPLTSNDLFSNLAFGSLSSLGLDPNQYSPSHLPLDNPFRELVAPAWLHTPSVYGPLINFFNAHFVQNNVWVSIIIYKLTYTAIALLIVSLTYFFLRKEMKDEEESKFHLIAFSLNPLLIWEVSGQAHNDAFLILCLLYFVIYVLQNKEYFTFLPLLLGFFTKLATLPLLVFYYFHLMINKKKFWLILLIPGFLLLILNFPNLYQKLTTLLVVPTNSKIEAYRLTNSIVSFIYFITGFWGSKFQYISYKLFWWFSALVLTVCGIRICFFKSSNKRFLLECFSYLILILYLFAPSFQPWYLCWLLPFALVPKNKPLVQWIALLPLPYLIFYPILVSQICGLFNVFVLIFYFKKIYPKLVMEMK